MEFSNSRRPLAVLLLHYLPSSHLAWQSAVRNGDRDMNIRNNGGPTAVAMSGGINESDEGKIHNRWSRSKVLATTIMVFCLATSVVNIINEKLTTYGSRRRSVKRRQERRLYKVQLLDDEHRLIMDEKDSNADILLKTQTYLLPLSTPPDPSKETALFWHIPKSGGTTAKELYRCFGKNIEIASRQEDIYHARDTGLVQSGDVDVIFSALPMYAMQQLFDEGHKARMLAIFRHPVERLISKFYYLQIADWERTYRPEWKEMDLLDWARGTNSEYNKYVKTLAGKYFFDNATEEDLEAAKQTIQSYIVVGLTNQMEESMRRFNAVLGIDDEGVRKNTKCMNSFFRSRKPVGRKNSNPHPKVEEDSPAYQLLAEKNSFDIRLYEYIEGLFEQQENEFSASII